MMQMDLRRIRGSRRRGSLGPARGLVLLAGAGALVLGGCGGSEGPSTAEMLEGVPINQAIGEIGGSCEVSGTQGRSNCRAEGVSFQLAHNSWVPQAGQRERECDTEQVSSQTKVLTNHSWMIMVDSPEELDGLSARLSEVGAPAQIKGYCDWDPTAGGTG